MVEELLGVMEINRFIGYRYKEAMLTSSSKPADSRAGSMMPFLHSLQPGTMVRSTIISPLTVVDL